MKKEEVDFGFKPLIVPIIFWIFLFHREICITSHSWTRYSPGERSEQDFWSRNKTVRLFITLKQTESEKTILLSTFLNMA